MDSRAEFEFSPMSKGEKTAMRIQEAAVDLVIRNGIDGTTVEQICLAAGVSERTFFNYFKTKDLAIIGDDLPTIDEAKAREFLAAPAGDIFTAAMDLIPGPRAKPGFHALLFKRLQMMRQNPGLFAAHMDKLLATRAEHAQLIYLRLRRSHGDAFSEAELRDMANQISEIVAGLFRSRMELGIQGRASHPSSPAESLGESLRALVEIGLKS